MNMIKNRQINYVFNIENRVPFELKNVLAHLNLLNEHYTFIT